jgi:hypothetical protein
MMTFSHWRLTCRDRKEMRRYRAFLQGMAAVPGAYEVGILHDDDQRCCRRESWEKTQAAVLDGLPLPVIVAR